MDPPEGRSMKKVWLRTLNTAIGRMMEARDSQLNKATFVDVSRETWEEVEEGMLDALVGDGDAAPTSTHANNATVHRSGRPRTRRDMPDPEYRETNQKIDTKAMRRLIEQKGTRSLIGARGVKILHAVRASKGILTQRYVRSKRDRTRWYATGVTQLQSAPKELTRVAVGGLAWDCDLDNAYPTIFANLLPASSGKWEELQAYALDKSAMRREVSEGFGISMQEAKRLLSSLLFGRSLPKWRQEQPDVIGPTPPRLRRLCSELAHARLILSRGNRRKGESQLTAVSRLIQVAEQSVMSQLETAMKEHGFEAGTLVHDALILQRVDQQASTGPDKGVIMAVAERTLAEIGARENWPVRLKVNVTRL